MAFIPVPNTAEVVLQGTQDGADALITLSFEQGEEFTIGNLEALLTAVEVWWDDNLSDLLAEAYLMPSIKATSLQTDHAPTLTDTSFTNHSGQAAVGIAPASVAMVVSFLTEFRGRSFRGRNYVPGQTPANMATSSTWTTGSVANMQAAYEALQTIMNDTPFTHVVVSRYSDNVPRLIGLTTPVTAYQAKAKIGNQRRRIAGTGS